jgi:hypothetical protein
MKIAAASVALLIAHCASAGKKPPQPTSFVIPDQVVTVAEGQFVFTGMTFGYCNDGPVQTGLTYLQGRVVNRTNRIWNVSFRMPARYSDGRIGDLGIVWLVGDFKPGESQPFRDRCGVYIAERDIAGLTNWNFVISHGSYRANYKFALVKPASSDALVFEDGSVAVGFVPTRQSMGFFLKNITESVMRIDWNQAALVDPSGKSHGIIHDGVKFADRNGVKAPTVVPPGARIEDVIVSTDNVSYSSSAGWITEDFLPPGPDAESLKGQTFSIYLPVQLEGKTIDYTFRFKIIDITY